MRAKEDKADILAQEFMTFMMLLIVISNIVFQRLSSTQEMFSRNSAAVKSKISQERRCAE